MNKREFTKWLKDNNWEQMESCSGVWEKEDATIELDNYRGKLWATFDIYCSTVQETFVPITALFSVDGKELSVKLIHISEDK